MGSMLDELGLDGASEAFMGLANAMTLVSGALSIINLLMPIFSAVTSVATIVTKLQATTTDESREAYLKEIKAKYGKIAATIIETIANWSLTASLGPIAVIILIIVAAIAVLILIVWLLIAAFNALKAQTPEAKLEAAQAASDRAAEAAKRAAEAY
jgi:hypothetical protein